MNLTFLRVLQFQIKRSSKLQRFVVKEIVWKVSLLRCQHDLFVFKLNSFSSITQVHVERIFFIFALQTRFEKSPGYIFERMNLPDFGKPSSFIHFK